MKKILHLSSCDHGGAGQAAYRLHRNLKAAGFQSKLVVCQKRGTDEDVLEAGAPGRISRLTTFLSRVRLKCLSNQEYYFQDQTRSLLGAPQQILRQIDFKPDLIVVHWVSNFVSAADIKALSLACDAPVIWYLLDMAPLTGGCHYAWDCSGYFGQCGTCPALYSINCQDRSHRIWQEKAKALEGVDLAVVAGSGWLERQALGSSLFRERPLRKILLSVDPEVFGVRPRCAARQELGLAPEKKVVFFGNQGLGLKRKGMAHLVEALRLLAADPAFDSENVLIAVAGHPVPGFELPLEYQSLGFLKGDAMLALAYQAADVFVCPSIEDSGPMMINESIMCGTPVVCFEMGVAPDLVQTAVTGYRAKLGDSEDLARGIRYLLSLSQEQALEMSQRCRELGLKMCHPEGQVAAFIEFAAAQGPDRNPVTKGE